MGVTKDGNSERPLNLRPTQPYFIYSTFLFHMFLANCIQSTIAEVQTNMRAGSATRQCLILGKLQIPDCDAAKRCCVYSASVGMLDGVGGAKSDGGNVEREDVADVATASSPSTSDASTESMGEIKEWHAEESRMISSRSRQPFSFSRYDFPARWNPIISAFKSMVKISKAKRRGQHLDPLLLSLTWEECSQLAIKQAGTLTSFEIAHIANSCKNGMYLNRELLGALVKRGRDPVVLNSFDPIQIGITTLAFGALAKQARDDCDKVTSGFLASSGQDFVRDLLRVGLDGEMFTSIDCGHITLSSLMKGVGLLFLKEGGQGVDRCIDLAAKEFTKKIVFYECSTHSYSNFLYGCVLMGYRDQKVLDNVVQSMIHSMVTFQDFSKMLGSILFSLGGLNLRHSEVVEMLGWKLVANIGAVHGKELERAALGFRWLEFDNEQILKPLCMEVVKEARLETISGGSLVSLIHALGGLKRDPQSVIKPLLLELLKPHRLAEMEVRFWRLVMHGLSSARFQDLKLLDALVGAFSTPKVLGEMSDIELMGVIQHWWILGYSNAWASIAVEDEVWKRLSSSSEQDILRVANWVGGMAFRTDKKPVESISAAVVSGDRLLGCSEQTLFNLVHGFTLLDAKDEELWLALGMEAIKDYRAGIFTPDQLAKMIHNFSKLNLIEPQIMVGLIKSATQQWGAFSAKQALLVVKGLGQWGDNLETFHGATVELLDLVALKVQEHGLEEFSMLEVQLLAWGLGRSRFFNADLLEAVIQRSMALFREGSGPDCKALISILKSCASLNHRDDRFLGFVRQHRIYEKVNRFGHVAMMMWALAMLDDLSLAEFTELSEIMEFWEKVEAAPTDLHWRQIVQSWLHVDVSGEAGRPLGAADPPMVAKAKEHCKASKVGRRSQFEWRVKEQLDKAGIWSESRVVLCGGLIDVDLLIKGEPPVVIECDGPWHYTINKVDGGYMPTGETIFRNRLLEILGYKVVCLPFYKDEMEQIDMISQALGLNCHESQGKSNSSRQQRIQHCAA
ncbi:hypothetical protein BSKO_12150 [Bryopsis sp. KO-2023]|nr:hypothetical protein BSKO_12150 [Bryopsis sp. KO-2023]